jgi:hypothetical protein
VKPGETIGKPGVGDEVKVVIRHVQEPVTGKVSDVSNYGVCVDYRSPITQSVVANWFYPCPSTPDGKSFVDRFNARINLT